MCRAASLLLALLISASPLAGQAVAPTSPGEAQEPRNVTFCELRKDPAAYNGELIRLRAFITWGFEDFTLTEPQCPSSPHKFEVWVTYGGMVPSGAIYCCPGEGGSDVRSKTLTVEGMELPLVQDATFQQFTALLKNEPDTTARVTVVGRFFAGQRQSISGSTWWGGYGHLGCCSLFVVQRVESFEPHSRKDVDYAAEAGWYEKEGCNIKSVRYLAHVSIAFADEEAERAISEQAMADSGERAWALADPERVAAESLKAFYRDRILILRLVKKTPVRRVYRWKEKKKSVVVVVTRPYWLSFYAKSSSVAWVATTIKEADCQ